MNDWPRYLVSFHGYRSIDLEAKLAALDDHGGVFADSGGFSAANSGACVELADYAAWLRRWGHLFDAYANLDVIGDAQASWDNQRRLEDAGLRPLPVFHVGSPWSYLERYVESYDRVALGGMVPHLAYRTRLVPWLVRCFELGGGRVRFHGFGATSWDVIGNLPFDSVDSTTWMTGHRYGSQLFWTGRKLFQTRAYLLPRYRPSLYALGVSLVEAQRALKGDPATARRIALASLQAAEGYLRKRHHSDLKIYAAGLL